MNDEPAGIMVDDTPIPTPPKSKKPIIFILPLLVLIALIVVVVLLAQNTVVAKDFAKTELDNWIAARAEQAKAQGIYLDISYGDLVFEGSAPPTAKLSDVDVHVASFADEERIAPSEEDGFHLRTKAVEVEPTSFDLSSFDITAESPILMNYGLDTFDAITIETAQPLRISTEQESTDIGTKLSLSHTLAPEMRIKSQDSSIASAVSYVMHFGADSTLETSLIVEAPRFGETEFEIHDMQITASDVAMLTIKEAELEWQKYPNEKGEDVSYSVGELENVSGHAMKALGSASLGWNINTTSIYSEDVETAFMSMESAKVEVKQLNFDAQGTSIDVTGQFEALEGDLLPVGNANISIMNLAKLREFLAGSGALTADDEVLADKLLMAMTGHGINEPGDIEIPIIRERDGAFMFGKARFEEALGIVFNHTLAMKQRHVPEQQPMPDEITEETPQE